MAKPRLSTAERETLEWLEKTAYGQTFRAIASGQAQTKAELTKIFTASGTAIASRLQELLQRGLISSENIRRRAPTDSYFSVNSARYSITEQAKRLLPHLTSTLKDAPPDTAPAEPQ